MTTTFKQAYEELVQGAITPDSVRAVFDAILRGEWTPVQVGAFVASLRLRGESADTIEAAARSMRAAMVPVEHDLPRVLDTCGTGGDGLGTVNISTAAAIIAAAAGVPVAKHGNRAVSSRSGSADVLVALGIPVDLPAASASTLLAEVGIAFMMAPTHHPAMRHAGQARKELGIRTIFNCLGPLANPANATHQLVGAYEDGLRPVMAQTLRELGSKRAWIVRGEDGLDEVSPCGPTRVTELDHGAIRETVVTPEDFGLERVAPEALVGGDAAANAAILEDILAGRPHPATSAIVLNAAAALVVADDIEPRAATSRVRDLLGSGGAAAKLDEWRRAASRLAGSPANG